MIFKVTRTEKIVASIFVEAESAEEAMKGAEAMHMIGDAFGYGDIVDADFNASEANKSDTQGRLVYSAREFLEAKWENADSREPEEKVWSAMQGGTDGG